MHSLFLLPSPNSAHTQHRMPLQLPANQTLSDWLQFLSGLSTPVIVGFAVFHLLFFGWLRAWCRRDVRMLADTLDQYTRGLHHRSVLDRSASLHVQIEAFVQDVHDVLADPSRTADRRLCLDRMQILDERRPCLDSLSFDTAVNATRTMIEAYPLSGVLGTVLAIGSALQADAAPQATSSVNLVMERFGDSIWSTFAGLLSAVVLMFVSSLSEVRFAGLSESRRRVRDLAARAKRELGLAVVPQEPPVS